MPELPEVETVVRGLRARLREWTITDVKVCYPGSIGSPGPAEFVERICGRSIASVDRRGKWILIGTADGQTLLVHLRMTGQLLVEPIADREDKYARVIFLLEDRSGDVQRLRFSDMRKFGRLILTEEPETVLAELGPEPLSDAFSVDRFAQMLGERRGRIKSLLLDQRFLAGLGNIYVNEVLWRAGIHPLRRANSLDHSEVAALHRAIRGVLQAAIRAGGTTLQNGNYVQSDGEAGDFIGELQVYGRQEAPCRRCGTLLERTKVGQRGTYHCPECQCPPPAG